jgi:DNA modification methylase
VTDRQALWANRIVGHGVKEASQFQANDKNWRTHPQAQRDALHGALNEVGWVAPVVENKRTGLLVDGHERVWQALQNGDAPVPYVEVDLSPEEEGYVLATLDPIGAMAAADKEQLDALLREVQSGEAGVQAMLAELAEDAGLYQEPKEAPEPQVDRAEELRGKWGTERGQVWQVGRHRLMCGDSTCAEDVATLLDGARPLLMVTDPPYGVEYDPAWRARAGVNQNDGKMGVVANDWRIDWREAWALFRGDVAYCWHAGRHASAVQDSLASAGFAVVAQVIWNKDRFALSRGDYHWKHEPCWYAVREGAAHHWAGARDQSTVWDVPRADDSGHGHGTQKPVECMARPIRNHEGDVYDPFLGSGTTMVAAEQLGRVCYGMEIEPKYVAVALERMAGMGLEPRLAETQNPAGQGGASGGA